LPAHFVQACFPSESIVHSAHPDPHLTQWANSVISVGRVYAVYVALQAVQVTFPAASSVHVAQFNGHSAHFPSLG
jgi:hypothetical protein